jgi:hypothetical protein
MKPTLKHKIMRYSLAFVGTIFILLCTMVVAPWSNSALAAATPCPSGQTRQNENLCCPKGQTATYSKSETKADARSCCPDSVASQGAKSCLFAKYVNPLVDFLAALVGIVVIGGIIYGGILFSTSAGDPQRAAQGRDHIRNALIGLVAYILLYTFLQFLIPGGKLNA